MDGGEEIKGCEGVIWVGRLLDFRLDGAMGGGDENKNKIRVEAGVAGWRIKIGLCEWVSCRWRGGK